MAQPAKLDNSPDLSGQTIVGRYKLDEMLGKGGFGSVYSGRAKDGSHDVAVKVFRRSEGLATRAEREARTASKLEHPNIHAVVGVESDDDNAYLISELVVGERFDRTDLDDLQAVRAIAAVADALAHAHSRGVVHRDVKPANILVSTTGEVCLTDFGIARDEDALENTIDQRLMGTLSYMAPEQAAGERASGATDVWAAGLTLYARLAGKNPYKARTLPELLEKLRAGVPPLADVRPDLPSDISDVLADALDHDPRRRPAASELRDRLLWALRPAEDDEPAAAVAAAGEPDADEPESEILRLAAERPAPPPRPRATQLHPLTARVLTSGLTVVAAMFALTAFPFYPPAWTLPLAVLLGVIAWFSPIGCLGVAGVMFTPCFWNLAQAAGIVWIGAVSAWIWQARSWERHRVLAPLVAWPLAVVGLGPAFVLVAATAPTRNRRMIEAALGAAIVLVAGSLVPAAATAAVPSANDPFIYVSVLAKAPAATAVAAAMIAFAALLPMAWNPASGKRAQSIALWGVGFGCALVAVPLLGGAGVTWMQAAAAAFVAALAAGAWARVGPRISFGR